MQELRLGDSLLKRAPIEVRRYEVKVGLPLSLASSGELPNQELNAWAERSHIGGSGPRWGS